MPTADMTPAPEAAKVDRLVDEQGYTIEIPEDSALKVATDVEQTVGATGPTNWWRMGLVALLALIVIALIWQFTAGNQGTNMVPGTPTSAPIGTPTP